MTVATAWENFYTDSDKGEDFVNHISIDVANKRFILDEGVSYLITDGFDENSKEVYSTYVSKAIFDMILKGVKENNYTEYRPA